MSEIYILGYLLLWYEIPQNVKLYICPILSFFLLLQGQWLHSRFQPLSISKKRKEERKTALLNPQLGAILSLFFFITKLFRVVNSFSTVSVNCHHIHSSSRFIWLLFYFKSFSFAYNWFAWYWFQSTYFKLVSRALNIHFYFKCIDVCLYSTTLGAPGFSHTSLLASFPPLEAHTSLPSLKLWELLKMTEQHN